MIITSQGLSAPAIARDIRRPVVDVLRALVDLRIRPVERRGGVALYAADVPERVRTYLAERPASSVAPVRVTGFRTMPYAKGARR